MPGIRFGSGPPGGAASDRRKRGSRVKRGLEELHDLDAKPSSPRPLQKGQKRPRDADPIAEDKDVAAGPPNDGHQGVPSLVHVDAEPETVFEEDWSDWLAVKTALFPSSKEAKMDRADEEAERALGVIRLWSARHRLDGAALPAYIEATLLVKDAQRLDAAAVAALHCDEDDRANVRSVPPMTCASAALSRTASVVRAAYAHAIGRTVHLITGSLIKSRSFANEASTYRDRAKQVGFPEEAVEVRHRIAHGSEPTLSELRWVASLVLQHLHDTFWASQAAHVAALQHEVKQVKQKQQPTTMAKANRKPKKMSLTDLESLLNDADEAIETAAAAEELSDGAATVNTRQFVVGDYCVVTAV